jgi:DNA-binding LytR/AlgR family response regulator
MDGIKVVIVEDEPLVAFDLKKQLEKTGMFVSGIFESGEEVLDSLKKDVPDIILMDVRLYGSLDGIDTAHEINKYHDVPILFLTANTDSSTFNRAKLTFPHAFLSKPFRIHDVLHAIELALEMKDDDAAESHAEKYLPDRVFIKNNDFLQKVMYDQILYLEAEGAYTKIITEDKNYVVSQTLKKVESKIQVPYLLKIHRSFIINTKNVDKISEGFAHIGKHRIPVSRAHRDALYKMFNIF